MSSDRIQQITSSSAESGNSTPMECRVTSEELRSLMEHRGILFSGHKRTHLQHLGEDALKLIEQRYGDVYGLCKMIGVDPVEGLPLSEEELERRRTLFGSNRIPMRRSKNIFEFAWEAITDKTLIILLISAVISIAISFYHPTTQDGKSKSYHSVNMFWL